MKMPKVGIGAIIIKNNQVLLGKRRGAHGSGSWSFPGGHLDFGESWEDCARREVFEETGLKLDNFKYVALTNDIFPKEEEHYITIYMQTHLRLGKEPQLLEPDKCEKWGWFDWNSLPKPLFIPVANLVKFGFNPLGS